MRKTAIVTGGARGIGRCIAENLARDHDVAVVWLNTAPDALSHDIFTIQSDLATKGSNEKIIEEVTAGSADWISLLTMLGLSNLPR